jgi:hypothetical protein
MLSLRLVIDTNVLVSAALKPESLQRTVFQLAITKPARLYTAFIAEPNAANPAMASASTVPAAWLLHAGRILAAT